MKKTRLLSALMAFCMVLSALLELSLLPVFATDTAPGEGEDSGEESAIDYYTQVYYTQQEKLATMNLMVDRFGYQLYFQPDTGEVAVKNKLTEEVMFTNPYDVAKQGSASSDDVREELLSQIILKYTNNENTSFTMTSFVEAALRNQIKVKNVKNGIRVEYTMGKQETRRLVPMLCTKERFEANIKSFVEATGTRDEKRKIESFFTLMDPNSSDVTSKIVAEMNLRYPVTKEQNPETGEYYAVYVIDPKTSEREFNILENIIKKHCVNYSYETLAEDHLIAQYEGNTEDPPLFKMSLEYYLDEDGVSVRLPANGIRFNQTAFTLNYIQILPFMGAGSSEFKGYTMIPDGSGTLIRFEDILAQGSVRVISGKVYGPDYTYYNPVGVTQEPMRMPVFGLVENYTYQVDEDGNIYIPDQVTTPETTLPPETEAPPADTDSAETGTPESAPAESGTPESAPAESGTTDTAGETEPPETEPEPVYTTVTSKRGFFAIMEEGASLATIYSAHGANITHKYNSVYTEFNPRPSDTYNLASVMSVGANANWTVVSDRKYTGSYRIRYIMLSDVEAAAEAGKDVTGQYDATYLGMAKAYQDQLVKTGVLQKLEEQAEKDTQIPMYIETLGVIDVLERVLTFPVTVQVPLTTFDDIEMMANDLKALGITNLNFRLTGFTNGGMVSAVPYKVKFEKAAGGNEGYKELLSYAKENGIGIFPDFDLSYAATDEWFDGFSYRTDAIRSIDNRYVRKKVYSPTMQYLETTGLVAISPFVFSNIFDGMKSYMDDLGVSGISVATLGSDLNTDFDKKDPYNREDNRQFVEDVLAEIKAAYGNVMVDGGNAYSLAYVNHVLNVSLDSSHYTYASETIPFLGLVFHGYLNFAGSPTNMAGDINYEILKIIESGASPYFILATQNIEEMKENTSLSKYYSVSYTNWKSDIGSVYHSLNSALADVMYATLVGHEFLIGERVKTDAEAAEDEEAAKEEAEQLKKDEEAALKDAARQIRLNARLAKEALAQAQLALPAAQQALADAQARLLALDETEIPAAQAALDAARAEVVAAQAALDAAQAAYDAAVAATADEETLATLTEALNAAKATLEEKTSAQTAAEKALGALNTEKSTLERKLPGLERGIINAEKKLNETIEKEADCAAKLAALEAGGNPIDILNGTTDEDEDEEIEEEKPEEEEYEYTKYTSDNGMIVRVTYSNGVSFIINYNNFAVTVEGHTIGAYDGMKFDANGNTVIESIRTLTHTDVEAK